MIGTHHPAPAKARRVSIGTAATAGGVLLDLRLDAPLDDPSALSPAELKRAAESLRQAYIEYIGSLAGEYGADPRWWTGTVAERNPFVSRAFFSTTRVAAGVARIESIEGDVHVRADGDIAASLAATLISRGQMVEAQAPAGRTRAAELAELAARRAFFTARILRRRMAARAAGLVRAARAAAGAELVVIHEWIDQRNFDAASGLLQPFANFSAVSARLKERGAKVATLAFVLRTVPFDAALRALATKDTVALVPEAFVGLGDIARIIARSAVRPRRRYPALAGIEVQAIFDTDDRRDWIHHRWAETELVDAMVRGWRRAGLDIGRVIYSFENHTWERAFCRALAREFPRARRIGFHGPALSRFRLNEYMTPAEWAACPGPHRVVTFGPLASQALAAAGAPGPCLATGAAPWLARLLSMPAPDPSRRAVLAVLSIDEAESREVLERTVAALGGREIAVIVKCHPTMPARRVWGSRPLPANVRFDSRAIAELLGESAVVVYGSSGGALEALGAGACPVHVRTSRVLDQDPLELWPDLHDVAESISHLATIVDDRLRESRVAAGERQARGRAVLSGYIGRDEPAWLEALTA